ncbi:MAG: hypothetical protein OEZ24_03735 [Candidatus Bathyarchaeota archaeon]|nr:hypothetical protein [Candidatus Bathyarchaeota archaeon]
MSQKRKACKTDLEEREDTANARSIEDDEKDFGSIPNLIFPSLKLTSATGVSSRRRFADLRDKADDHVPDILELS